MPLHTRIFRLRKLFNMTQMELAQSAGLSQGCICHLEKMRRRKVGADTLSRLARALRLDDADDLLMGSWKEVDLCFRQKLADEALQAAMDIFQDMVAASAFHRIELMLERAVYVPSTPIEILVGILTVLHPIGELVGYGRFYLAVELRLLHDLAHEIAADLLVGLGP